MLNKQSNDQGLYTCNFCGKQYTLDEAERAKGNHFLCSANCVIAYQAKWDYESNRDGNA
jgi:hypothetical protein